MPCLARPARYPPPPLGLTQARFAKLLAVAQIVESPRVALEPMSIVGKMLFTTLTRALGLMLRLIRWVDL